MSARHAQESAGPQGPAGPVRAWPWCSGVMFVSGAFVLTDTLGRSFDAVFADGYSRASTSTSRRSRRWRVSEMEGEQVPTPLPAATWCSGSKRCRRRRGDRRGRRRRRPGDRQQRQGRHLVRSAAAGRRTGPARATWCSCARAARPQADDEIVVNAALAKQARPAGRRPGRRAHPASRRRSFTLVGIFGYSGDRDSIGGVQEVAFTSRSRSG